MVVSLFVLYSREMLDTMGSFALLSMTIFMVGMGLITYRFGFGLRQDQRSVMSLGMLTRNGAAVLIAALAIPNVDPRIITMTVMWVIWSLVLAAIVARVFGKQAGKGVAVGTA
jgi:Kef-type K+ transport system membrane component KefB